MTLAFRRRIAGTTRARARCLLVACALPLALATASSGAGAQTIDTRGANNTTINGGTGLWGQSFIATGTDLTDFSFWVGGLGASSYSYITYLYAFSPGTQQLLGGPIFQSALQTSPVPVSPQIQATFATPGVMLTPGNVYMAIIRNTNPNGVLILGLASNTGCCAVTSTYAGGSAWTAPNNANPAAVTYTQQGYGSPRDPGNDFEFQARFGPPVTAAPEPASLLMLAAGLVGFVAHRRRRERATRMSPELSAVIPK